MRNIPLISFYFPLFSFIFFILFIIFRLFFSYAFIKSLLDDQMLNSQSKIKAVRKCEAMTIEVGIICESRGQRVGA